MGRNPVFRTYLASASKADSMTDIRLIQVNDCDGNKRLIHGAKHRRMVGGNLAQLRLPNIVQNPQKLNGYQWPAVVQFL
jgi:hypothetical protein